MDTCRFETKTIALTQSHRVIVEGLDGGGGEEGSVWNSLISKNLAHYSLSLNLLLIL